MLNKPPSKKQIRTRLENDIEEFLNRGEKIEQVPKGISSRNEATGPIRPNSWQMGKKSSERTYVPEVIEALESRKIKERKPSSTTATKRPRKRLIYDDFGEPLRWVWVDE